MYIKHISFQICGLLVDPTAKRPNDLYLTQCSHACMIFKGDYINNSIKQFLLTAVYVTVVANGRIRFLWKSKNIGTLKCLIMCFSQ